MELYKPFKSKAKNKKYSVYVKGGKLIHFGDKRYGQYKDKIGLYSHLDHNDKKKRESYHSRFGPATDNHVDVEHVRRRNEEIRNRNKSMDGGA